MQTTNFSRQLILSILLAIVTISVNAQFTQTIKGTVIDLNSNVPLPGASVVLVNTNPIMGSATDVDGNYRIEKVPVGRYSLKVQFVGYEPTIIPEILVTTGKEVVVNVTLKESVVDIKEVIISANKKDKTLNSMAIISARTISVEESSRYAGGIDDPGRLVSAFAGVSTISSETNAIIIRGNTPKGVSYRLEDVDIPNPNHFGDLMILGGGFTTALSSQVLGNSDFFTGAFPAEYGNALSGVFDIKMRTGNTDKREYTFQAGLMGIDFASEGPFSKGSKASYIFNYRYSTFGLLKAFLPDVKDLPDYQDFSFKINLPTLKYGTFTLWGLGAIDHIEKPATDTTELEWSEDLRKFEMNAKFGMIGLSNKYILGNKTYFKTSLLASANTADYKEERLDNNNVLYDNIRSKSTEGYYSLSFLVNHKFSSRHTNRTGFSVKNLFYRGNLKSADEINQPMQQIVNDNMTGYLLEAYSQSKVDITKDLTLNAGVHFQYLDINQKNSVEPRAGMTWNFAPRHSVTLAYGLHSQAELIRFYYIKSNNQYLNKDLDFAKSQHFVLGYNFSISNNLRIKIEPYYQMLFNIPCVPDTSLSIINITHDDDFKRKLVNTGTGTNIGVDITLERFLNKGFYYLLTASIFDSKYKGDDGVEHNTLYNRNYTVNLLGGKEWQIGSNGKNNTLGVNVRLYYMGGSRYTPLNEQETILLKKNVYDGNQIFAKQYGPSYRLDLGFSYRINKANLSHVFSLQILNSLGSKDHQGYEYNYKTKSIAEKTATNVLPVMSYKIEF